MSRRTGVSNARNTNSNNDRHKRMEEQKEERKVVKTDEQTTPEKGQPAKKEKMTKHIDTRNKIKGIADMSSFNDLLNKSTLSDEDKLLLQLHYIQGKDFRYIGDMLGYAESTIKHRHRRILKKLSNMI